MKEWIEKIYDENHKYPTLNHPLTSHDWPCMVSGQGKVKHSVMFYTFTKFLTIHQQNLNQMY